LDIKSILNNRILPDKQKVLLKDIELPIEISSLVQNPIYNNRYKWLIREYGLDFMLRVAKFARACGKNHQRFFATLCSKANIQKTIETITKYYKKAESIARVIKERPEVFHGFVYKNILKMPIDKINSLLARSSDAINPSKTFVYYSLL
jgi:hypothetical protein